VSILLREGEIFSFLHRSFQEYFTAVFLADRQVPRNEELFLSIAARLHSDSVIALLKEINNDAFENKYFGPLIAQLRNEIDRIGVGENPSEILSLFFLSFSGNRKNKAEGLSPGKWGPLLYLVDFHKKSAKDFAFTEKKLWDELAVRLLRHLHSSDRRFDIAVKEIPVALLKETRLYKGLLETCGAIQSCDNELKRSVSHKTDLVKELLRRLD
jgi:hypothetical protein